MFCAIKYWIGMRPPAVAGDIAHPPRLVFSTYFDCCSHRLARLLPHVGCIPDFLWASIPTLYAEDCGTLGVSSWEGFV